MGGWHTPRWPSKKKGTHGNTRARTGGAASIAAGGPIAYHDCIRGLSRTLVTPCEPQSTQHGSRVPSSFSYPYRLFRACTVAPPRRRSSPGRPPAAGRRCRMIARSARVAVHTSAATVAYFHLPIDDATGTYVSLTRRRRGALFGASTAAAGGRRPAIDMI